MVRIAVVDDEKVCIEYTRKNVLRYFNGDESAFSINEFSDGLDLLNQYSGNYDIILMDIEMKHLDGMEASRKLRKIDSSVILIFMTKMAQYAACGYDVDAIGFLVKPVDYYSFQMKMKKALGMIEQRKGVNLVISDNYGKRVLSSNDIHYIEVISHSVIFHTAQGEYKSWCSLKECASKLEKAHFALTGRFYLVNLEYVKVVNDKSVIVAGDQIPLSRSKKKGFMMALTEYYGGGKSVD